MLRRSTLSVRAVAHTMKLGVSSESLVILTALAARYIDLIVELALHDGVSIYR